MNRTGTTTKLPFHELSYGRRHERIYAARGKPKNCDACGTTDSAKRYEWANISGEHRDVWDYERLCRSCHAKRDVTAEAREKRSESMRKWAVENPEAVALRALNARAARWGER